MMLRFGSKRSVLMFYSAAFAIALLATGCAETSPAVGTWTDTVSTPGTKGSFGAKLTLAADGTGTVILLPGLHDKPIAWKKGENKTIQLSMVPAGGPTMPATLSDDGNSMTLEIVPNKSIALVKSEPD